MISGKGVWIWKVYTLHGGDVDNVQVDKIVQTALDLGLSHVFIKTHDGPFLYNVKWRNWPVWSGGVEEDLLPPVVAALQNVGIQCLGWTWPFIYNVEDQAKAHVARCKALGMAGLVLDIEGYHQDNRNWKKPGLEPTALSYMNALRAEGGDDFLLGFSSYRFPRIHPEVAYEPFLRECDFNTFQHYWVRSHNPSAQLDSALVDYNNLYQKFAIEPLPTLPSGGAYPAGDWFPTEADWQGFIARVEHHGLPGFSTWHWDSVTRPPMTPDVYNVIRDAPGVPPAPPPPQEEDFLEMTAAERWQIVSDDLLARGVIDS